MMSESRPGVRIGGVAFMAYGRRASVDSQAVIYDFGEAIDLGSEGALVIALLDPTGWRVPGDGGVSYTAERIYAKVMKAWRASGEWPEYVGYSS